MLRPSEHANLCAHVQPRQTLQVWGLLASDEQVTSGCPAACLAKQLTELRMQGSAQRPEHGARMAAMIAGLKFVAMLPDAESLPFVCGRLLR